MIVIELLNNVAWLLTFTILHSFISRKWDQDKIKGKIIAGCLFGGIAIGVMANPMNLLPGIVFDTRSVLISLAGLFGGPVPVSIAALFAGAFRVWMGGAGIAPGLSVIAVSGIIGIACHYWPRKKLIVSTPLYLYGFGLLVHAVMLLCMLLLPWPLALKVLKEISIPVMAIYPVATLLIAQVLIEQEKKFRNEKALRASEERFKRLLTRLPIPLSFATKDGIIKYVNNRFTDTFGYTLEDIKTVDKWRPLAYPDEDYRRDVIRTWQEAAKEADEGNSDIRPLEYNVTCKNGDIKVIEISGATIENEVLTTFIDITQRKQAEAQLRESEEKFRLAFETSPDSINVNRLEDGLYVDINEGFTSLTGFSREEVIGKTSLEIQIWHDTEDRNRLIQDLKEKGFCTNLEARFRKKDGSLTTALMSARIIMLKGVPHIISITRDISEIRKAEEEKQRLETQLQQAQKMEAVGTLAGGIAHDFNNILQAIKGYTQIMLMDRNIDDPEYPTLTAVEKAAERAAQLVRQLLLFSRKVEAEHRPVDLNQEAAQARVMLERTIPRMVEIDFHPGGRLWKVNADPVQMEQVLLNLGGNAADAMPDGGRLTIETENIVIDEEYARTHLDAQPGRYVLVTISDTGSGIDRETMKHIFEPFFTTKEVGKGTGLGLASAYGIVKHHGGYMMCYSEVGQGTTFKIYLPALDDEAFEPGDAEAEQPLVGGTETILLVDDEDSVRGFAVQALERFGYKIITASQGEEALEIYMSTPDPIDIIILDIGMPGMGGYKCLKEIMRLNPQAKVVIASGYSLNGQLKKIMESGAAGYISKPYQLRDLLGTIRAVLNQKERDRH